MRWKIYLIQMLRITIGLICCLFKILWQQCPSQNTNILDQTRIQQNLVFRFLSTSNGSSLEFWQPVWAFVSRTFLRSAAFPLHWRSILQQSELMYALLPAVFYCRVQYSSAECSILLQRAVQCPHWKWLPATPCTLQPFIIRTPAYVNRRPESQTFIKYSGAMVMRAPYLPRRVFVWSPRQQSQEKIQTYFVESCLSHILSFHNNIFAEADNLYKTIQILFFKQCLMLLHWNGKVCGGIWGDFHRCVVPGWHVAGGHSPGDA